MTESKVPRHRKLFDREMIRMMLVSTTFRKAITEEIGDSSLANKSASLLTEADWDRLEDVCPNVFREAAPTVCIATIPQGMESAYNDDPLPQIIGCDGVFAIFDISGFGLEGDWFTSAEDAISAAESNWTELSFSMQRKRKSRAKAQTNTRSDTEQLVTNLSSEMVAHCRRVVADYGLTHHVEKALALYELRHPDSDYKTYITGMGHLFRKDRFIGRVERYLAEKGSLPHDRVLQKWIEADS